MDLKKCSTEAAAAAATTTTTTTKKGDSSNLMEVTKPVEETPAVATSSMTKRKAESDLEEETEESLDDDEDDEYESEETEESGDEEKWEYVDPEREFSSAWTTPEWDVDSFDGLEYDSEEEFDPEWWPNPEEVESARRYTRMAIESKGFYVELALTPMAIRPILDLEANAGQGQTYREFFEDIAQCCIQRYNSEHSQENGFTLEFVDVVRGNRSAGSKSKSYVTFMAKEKPDETPIEYQAKAWSGFKKGEDYPILCRRAPPLPLSCQKN